MGLSLGPTCMQDRGAKYVCDCIPLPLPMTLHVNLLLKLILSEVVKRLLKETPRRTEQEAPKPEVPVFRSAKDVVREEQERQAAKVREMSKASKWAQALETEVKMKTPRRTTGNATLPSASGVLGRLFQQARKKPDPSVILSITVSS